MILYVVTIVSGFLWSFRMAMNIPSFMMHQLKMAIPSIIYRSLHIDDSLFMPCCITDILEQASPIHWLRFSSGEEMDAEQVWIMMGYNVILTN